VAERKKFEFDGQQWKDRARKYREQSGAVKTNEAYKALQHEIANAEAEVAKADDRQLEVMMAAEEVERRVKIAESRLKEAEQAVTAERKEIQAQGGEKKKQLDAASAEREKIIAPVPEDLRELYARIAKRHNGTAMAEARDGQCRGCGMRVLPHILQELRSETNEEVFSLRKLRPDSLHPGANSCGESCRWFRKHNFSGFDKFLMRTPANSPRKRFIRRSPRAAPARCRVSREH